MSPRGEPHRMDILGPIAFYHKDDGRHAYLGTRDSCITRV